MFQSEYSCMDPLPLSKCNIVVVFLHFFLQNQQRVETSLLLLWVCIVLPVIDHISL